jgi:argininosuccinate lyase
MLQATENQLSRALRKSKRELEKLLVGHGVPPAEAYDVLAEAINHLPREGDHLEERLLEEAKASIRRWRKLHRRPGLNGKG